MQAYYRGLDYMRGHVSVDMGGFDIILSVKHFTYPLAENYFNQPTPSTYPLVTLHDLAIALTTSKTLRRVYNGGVSKNRRKRCRLSLSGS